MHVHIYITTIRFFAIFELFFTTFLRFFPCIVSTVVCRYYRNMYTLYYICKNLVEWVNVNVTYITYTVLRSYIYIYICAYQEPTYTYTHNTNKNNVFGWIAKQCFLLSCPTQNCGQACCLSVCTFVHIYVYIHDWVYVHVYIIDHIYMYI